MFTIKRDRRTRWRGDAGRALANRIGRCGSSNSLALRGREQEGRMRGKDDMRQRFGPARREGIEIRFLVSKAGNAGIVDGQFNRPHQARQPLCARLQAMALQLSHQALKLTQCQLAAFKLARQFQPQLEDRIEQRRLSRADVQLLQASV
jgi:hypothetical protein